VGVQEKLVGVQGRGSILGLLGEIRRLEVTCRALGGG
jgi:hypothetical protein